MRLLSPDTPAPDTPAPDTPAPDTPASDLAACRTLLRGGSRSFFAASLLLPRRVHEPATALYAFCRIADDAIDLHGARVASLRVRLRRAYDGCPRPMAADRALAAVVARHAIPIALPEALLEGLAWDAAGRRYADFPALLDYAARVAGSIGAMMAMLMGVHAPEMVARACDLGVAMQLSNIARDVGEDARNGRLYLPLDWLRQEGIAADAFLARPVFDARLAAVVARLLREAEVFYARAAGGIAGLPASCRPGISAARILYAEIGREVERHGFDSVSRRAHVPLRRKPALLARALVASWRRPPVVTAPPLDAVRFLVEAVAHAPYDRPVAAAPPRRSLDDRIAWLVDLFGRLDARQQVGS